MKKFSGLIVFFFVFSSAYARKYDLAELLNLMQRNNLLLKIEKTKEEELSAKIKGFKSYDLPKVWATFGGERQEVPSMTSLNEENLVGEFHADYKLYTFGKISNQIKALESSRSEQKKIGRFRLLEMRKKLEEEYYHALFFKEQLNLLNEELIFNKTLRKQVRRKRKQGLVGNADLLEVDMRDATLKHSILKNEEYYQHTLDSIRKILFVDHDFEIDLAGEISHHHYSLVSGDLVKATQDKNIELAKAVSQVEINNYLVKSNSADRLPEVNLRGRFGKMRIDEKYTDNRLEGIVGLYVDIPIFDGQRSAKYNVQEAIAKRKRLQLERARNNTNIDVIHSLEKMTNIHKQVDLGEVNVKNALVYFKNVSREYNRGIKNSIDLVSARDRLVYFKQGLLSSKRDYILTKIKLEKISGVAIN